jgi:Lipase (class 3)
MPAPTLDGRLLCASGAAYAITGDMKTLAHDPKDVYITGAGFVQPPAVFTAGTDAIDGCLVGQIQDGLILAFRGTMPFDLNSPPSVRDWVSDFHAEPITVAGFPGAVHAGFSGALTALWPHITAELQRQSAAAPPDRPLLITGHSKGGAMAALAAWALKAIAGTPPLKVVTFAAAKPGDADFRAAYQAAGIDHTRYEYNIDIVPHLPLSDGGFMDVLAKFPLADLPWFHDLFTNLDRFDYQPVGTLRYIESDGQIVGDSVQLRAERDQALAVEIIRFQFAQIAMNHAIGCGSGYMSTIAPTGVCPSASP